MSETIIPFRPQTDFEKMLFERAANKDLLKKLKESRIENGILLSERDELVDQLKRIELKPDPGKRDFRRRYELMKRRCNNMEVNVKRLRKTNGELICRIIQLEKKIVNKNFD